MSIERFLERAYVIYENAYVNEFFIGTRLEAEMYCEKLNGLFKKIYSVGKESYPVMVSDSSDVWHMNCIK